MRFSVSNKKGSGKAKGTYTFDYVVKDIETVHDIKDGGFSSTIFKDGHRKGENAIGLCDLGYVDIDGGFEPLYKEEDLRAFCKDNFWLTRSQSNMEGKFRLIYLRQISVDIVGDLGVVSMFGMEVYSFPKEHMSMFITNILEQELVFFEENIPGGNVSNIDATSTNSSMHSKELGEVLYECDLRPIYIDYDYGAFKKRTVSNFNVVEVGEYGLTSIFKPVIKKGKEMLILKSGNIFQVDGREGLLDVTIGEALVGKYHLYDPLRELGGRCEDGDAYMPFIMSLVGEVIYVSAWGQHNGNKGNSILIVFERGIVDKKYSSLVSIDGVDYWIDEKFKKFMEKL